VQFHGSSTPGNNYRGTVEAAPARYRELPPVRNVYAGVLVGQKFDFVKMDIEGSEGALIDDWLLPHCSRLVMEYHTSRDPNPEHLKRRLKILKEHFERVKYPACFDTLKGFPPRFDQLIFCWNPK
jgi:hypothetical protein